MIDFNRIARLIKQTKDKIIVATDDDMLVVMDMDSYEGLIREQVDIKPLVKKRDILEERVDMSKIEQVPISSPTLIKDVLAKKTNLEADFNQLPISNTIPDEEDEYYFEEVED